MSLSAGKLWGLRRLADASGRFKMLAVDQRPPIKALVRERRGLDEAPYEDQAAVKALLVRVLAPHASAALLDPHVAYPQAVAHLDPARGLIATLEDSIFEETPGGRKSRAIDDWSVEKIKRTGADAVKVLAWYRPDAAPDVVAHQQAFVRGVGDACRRFDIPFVFELLVYPLPGEAAQTTDYVEDAAKHPERVLESVRTFAAPEYGVDLFKLESPVPAAEVPDPEGGDAAAVARTAALFEELGRLAGRPWVMLSAGAGMEAFERVLRFAYVAGASGYLAGRAIWWQAFQAFPDLEAMERGLRETGVPYMERINRLTDAAAPPWTARSEAGVDLAHRGAGFRSRYVDFGRFA